MSVSLFLSGCHPAANIQAKFRYISNRFARRALWMSMWWEPCSRPIQLNKIYIVFTQAVTHPGTNTARRCLTSGQWEIEIQTLIAPVGAFRNCLRQLCFKSKWRGIGYSFQLAITAPLYSITGYCIATAQSCGLQTLFHLYTYLPSNPCWIRKVTFYSISWFKRISHVNLAQLDELLFPSNIYCAFDMSLPKVVPI